MKICCHSVLWFGSLFSDQCMEAKIYETFNIKDIAKTQCHRCFLQYFLCTCINIIFAINMLNLCWKNKGYYLNNITFFTNTIVIFKNILNPQDPSKAVKQYCFFIANTALIIFVKHFAFICWFNFLVCSDMKFWSGNQLI